MTTPATTPDARSSHSTGSGIAVLALLGSMVSLCVGSSFAKQLFPAVGAQGTTAYRIVTAALILLAIWRPWRFRLTRPDARAIVLYGISLGCMNLLFYLSLRTVPIGAAIALEFTGPLLLAVYLSRRALDFLWIGFAVVGLVVLLPFNDLGGGRLDPTGVAYALAAGVCWVLYIIFGKRAGNVHGGQATALGMTVAAVVVLPFGIGTAGAALLDPAWIAVGVAVGILSSALPYSLEMVALKRLPQKSFGILLSMEPAIGAMAGAVILHEMLTVPQWLAIGSIVLASVGSTATSRVRAAPPPPPAGG